MKRTIIGILAALALFAGTASRAQDSSADTNRVREMDEFHKFLHPLIHDAYPNNDFTTIRNSLPNLVRLATKLSKASLPDKKTLKKSEFRKETKKLVKQLTMMNKKKDKLTDQQLGKQFMEMHDTFEGIMEMLE